MRLYPDEPAVTRWDRVPEAVLAERLQAWIGMAANGLVLIDGRSGAGKTTLAEAVAEQLDAAIVHTDDVAWHHDPCDWSRLLIDHIIEPWRRGRPVSYTPPGWLAHARPGAIEVPVRNVLVVEGVGAARAELSLRAGVTIWLQSDRIQAKRLGLAGDVELGRTPEEAASFWGEWMSFEEPFQRASRPWTRADLVIRGVTLEPVQDRCWFVSEGPLAGTELQP